MSDTPTPLQPVREDWDRALVVVAHPDDVEFGTAAAVARWTTQGKSVSYCMATSGEAGIDALEPAECGRLREAEEIASARVVGVDTVEFLGLPDGVIEFGVPLRAAIARQIRRLRPDIVVTQNFRETWGGRTPNQADHIAVGRAALHAAQDAGNRWIFADQLETEGLEPWGGVREVWAAGSPDATHAVDTSDSFDRGVASLALQEQYIKGLGWEPFDPAEFLAGMSRPAGSRLGTTHAVAFEVFSMAWGE